MFTFALVKLFSRQIFYDGWLKTEVNCSPPKIPSFINKAYFCKYKCSQIFKQYSIYSKTTTKFIKHA